MRAIYPASGLFGRVTGWLGGLAGVVWQGWFGRGGLAGVVWLGWLGGVWLACVVGWFGWIVWLGGLAGWFGLDGLDSLVGFGLARMVGWFGWGGLAVWQGWFGLAALRQGEYSDIDMAKGVGEIPPTPLCGIIRR